MSFFILKNLLASGFGSIPAPNAGCETCSHHRPHCPPLPPLFPMESHDKYRWINSMKEPSQRCCTSTALREKQQKKEVLGFQVRSKVKEGQLCIIKVVGLGRLLHWSLLPQLLCGSMCPSTCTGGTIPSSGPCGSPIGLGHAQLPQLKIRQALTKNASPCHVFAQSVNFQRGDLWPLQTLPKQLAKFQFSPWNVPKSRASSDKGLPPGHINTRTSPNKRNRRNQQTDIHLQVSLGYLRLKKNCMGFSSFVKAGLGSPT